MTKCILFDSDGTLVDSELLCNRAIAIKFKELGVDLCEHDLMLRFRGGKMSEVLAQLSEQNDVQLADDILVSYRKLVAQLFESDLKPVEGVIEALQQLPMHKAVVSNGLDRKSFKP